MRAGTVRVPRPVLDALADALQLSADERAYLGTLAEVAPVTRRRVPAKPEVTPQLRQLLEDMSASRRCTGAWTS